MGLVWGLVQSLQNFVLRRPREPLFKPALAAARPCALCGVRFAGGGFLLLLTATPAFFFFFLN